MQIGVDLAGHGPGAAGVPRGLNGVGEVEAGGGQSGRRRIDSQLGGRVLGEHSGRAAGPEQLRQVGNRGVGRARRRSLATCEWIAKGYPLCLIGDSGTGKSHLLVAGRFT
ncbi:hypothetical protein GCM10009578_065490 [Streptomyces rhizosphaericus]